MSEFYEPYRDWDPCIAWTELKERDPALRDSQKKKGIKEKKQKKINKEKALPCQAYISLPLPPS